MNGSRRRFLQATLGSTALVSTSASVPDFLAATARAATAAKPAADRVLVVVQLSGGNDGLNTVIPFADDAYAANRFTLRIADSQVVKLDDYVGLHPQLKALKKVLDDGRLTIVQGVGYPNPDRSHFRSMDIWHSAQPQVENPRDGWLGRSLEHAPGRSAGEIPALYLGANQLPLALATRACAVPSIDSIDRFRLRTDAVLPETLRQLSETPRPGASPRLDFLRRSALNAYAASQQVQEAVSEERTAAQYPALGLAQKLKTVAQLIDAGLQTRIYYLTLDGFDTHANQLPTHANLLRELSESVAAFVADLTGRGHLDRVLLLTFSEFGRRVRENASQGTDHGAAAPVFLAGGKVASGVIGKHPSLSDLDQGDLRFHTDFRRLYATILDRWLGCSSMSVLGQKLDELPLLKA